MDQAAIRDQIDRILRSTTFASKGQLRKLLEVLSENRDSQTTLKPDRVIRELSPEEVRTKGSADVATEINRLRHALDAYYNGEGKADPIIITLPNRSAAAPDGTPEKRWIAAKPRGADGQPPSASPNSHRTLITLAVIAIVVVAVFVTFRLLAKDRQPQSARIDGTVLRIMDSEGKEIWSKSFPEGFGPDWYYDKNNGGPHVWFADLEGKGHTSVLFSYSAGGTILVPHPTTLICYSDRGKEKWRWTPGRDLPELNGSPPTYLINSLGILNGAEKGRLRIVVLSQHIPWWPSQVAFLDSRGKTISEYWHSGGLSHMTLADLDGDGRDEIIVTGTANGYDHQATLVVLDPDRVFGASTEVRPEFQIHGMGVAQERLRLLFPRSDLNRALYQFNLATGPAFERGVLRLTVLECIIPAPSLGCPIWYEFDKNFRLIAAYAGNDDFRSAHNRFYQTGKNAHTLSAAEQAAFQRVRCLVGCKTESVPVGKLVP